MDVRNGCGRWWAGAAWMLLLVGLTGCAGFFPPMTTTTTGTTTTNTGDYAYVASSLTSSNTGIYTLTGYSIGTGTLSVLSGFPLALPFSPTAVVINPANTLLFVAGNSVIYGYDISSAGALTAIANGGNVALANADVVSMDISPDGQWLFALDGNGVTIDQFQIGSTGLLTSFAGASYAVTTGIATPRSIKVSQNENSPYVAIALGTAGDLMYSFNTSTGAMAPAATVNVPTVSTADQAVTFDAAGAVLYVARSGTDGGVVPYTIGSGGALTAVSGAPFATGAGPASIVLNSAGTALYVGNKTDSTISAFSVASGGKLTAVSGSPYASGLGVTALGRDNSGDYLLAVSVGGSPDLQMYSFDTTVAGKLDPVTSASTGDPDEPAGAVAIALMH